MANGGPQIVIRKKNPLKKAEIPLVAIICFYIFLFFSMAGGDLGIMISNLFSFENGVIGLTIAAIGFGISILMNLFTVSTIIIDQSAIVAKTRVGLKRKYPLGELNICRVKWYELRKKKFPFFQFNFTTGKKLQLVGHHYTGLKPFLQFLKINLGQKFKEIS